MNFISVLDDLPPYNVLYPVYTEVYGTYDLARFNPSIGWIDASDKRLNNVTHWLPMPIPMQFERTNEFNEAAASKWGLLNE